MKTIEIKGVATIVDDEDVDFILSKKWQIMKSYKRIYFQHKYLDKITHKYKGYTLHRALMGLPAKGLYVDHIDNNPLNNSKANLRICNAAQNAWNRKKESSNTSGYKGVSYHAKSNKWRANIRVNKKLLSLGLYDTKESAYEAYCFASKKYHGEYGRTE